MERRCEGDDYRRGKRQIFAWGMGNRSSPGPLSLHSEGPPSPHRAASSWVVPWEPCADIRAIGMFTMGSTSLGEATEDPRRLDRPDVRGNAHLRLVRRFFRLGRWWALIRRIRFLEGRITPWLGQNG